MIKCGNVYLVISPSTIRFVAVFGHGKSMI